MASFSSGLQTISLKDIRKRANDEALQPIRYILIDFRLVNGVDSSAANSFTQNEALCAGQGLLH